MLTDRVQCAQQWRHQAGEQRRQRSPLVPRSGSPGMTFHSPRLHAGTLQVNRHLHSVYLSLVITNV